MAIVNQSPASLSLAGNLKTFKISSTESVQFRLLKGGVELLSQRYEPGADGVLEIDVKAAVFASLSYSIGANNAFVQSGIAADFIGEVDGVAYSFRAVRGGVANLADTDSNWLRNHFLTWQPKIKPVTYYTPEWLTYYGVQEATIKLLATFDGGATQTITLASVSAGTAVTVNVQYASIAGRLGNVYPTHYKVWAEAAGGARLTDEQFYTYSEPLSDDEEWYLFENSLGGLDTFRAYGVNNFDGTHTHQIAEFGDTYKEYDVETERIYNKNTGYLNEYARVWMLDFFPSRAKYVYADNAIRQIVVTDSDVKYVSSDLPSAYSFSYKFADNTRYLNLIRNESELPANLVVPNTDAPDFIIPPRLAELPRILLTEGVLIPAFDPNSPTATVTTFGEIMQVIVERTLASIPTTGGGSGTGTLVVLLPSTDNVTDPSDSTVFTSLKAIKEIEKAIAAHVNNLDARYLRKDAVDTARKLIKFLEGIEVGEFTSGTLGTGAAIHVDENGNSIAEVDKLKVRKRAEFFEVLIQTSKHVGGELIVSPANMICNKVEELAGAYRCYFDRGDNNEAFNEFVVGDQARCNVFTGSGQKYYWRLVTSVGLDYIDLSKTDCDIDSDIPALGDNIFHLGHRTDPERQSAQIISSYGPDSPSYIQYGGINSFSLVGKSLTKFTGKGNEIFGKLHIQSGSTGWTNIDGLPEEFMAANEYAQSLINGISLGTVNLLRNTAFTGDYVSKDLSATDELAASDQLYSEPLKYWNSYGSNAVFIELDSTSGFGVSINGTLGQTTPKLVAGESYMMSFKAKGSGNLIVGLGDNSISVTLATAYSEFVLKFVPTETKAYDFYFQGIASIYEPQLERGTIASKWSYSPVDAHKSEERFQAIKYITSAIIDGSVDVIGGLILCNMLQLGNYKDGVLEKVTSGLSGIYNDDDDPAFWAGGTLEDAIRAIMNPDDTSGANAVITHGGRAIFNDAIIRGIIYATGGLFRGRIESNMDGSRIIIDPETRDIKMIDTLGREVASYGFYQVEGQSGPKVTLKAYEGETTTVLASSVLFAGRLTIYDGDVNIVNFVADLGSKSIQLNPDKIPNAGTYVGDLYKDGNTLKIKIS